MHSPTIAKLLAKENIEVQYGNYRTAWFDVKNRVLGLPMLKDMGKDVHDLFVGHEVGHALYTPEDGWHESEKKIKNAPRSYINVTEDARIERFVQRDYPGLVGRFRRGYAKLVEDNFFGDIDDMDWDKVKLIDKINLKAKIGPHLDVPFNDEEIVFYKRAMTTKTFDEVIDLSRDILDYTKENQEELLTPPPPPPEMSEGNIPEGMDEDNDPMPAGHDDYEMPEGEMEEEQEQVSDSSDGDESDDCKEDNIDSSESNDDDTPSEDDESLKEKASPAPVPEVSDYEESITDMAAKEYERNNLDVDANGRQKQIGREPSNKFMDECVFTFDEVHEQRLETRRIRNCLYLEKDQYNRDITIMDGYKEYMANVKKASYYAVKEFEQRKAAYQWQRAQTAKSGTLDVNKVHSYKYNEDIFARVTQLADAKNHGMIMLIDLSGSMGNTLYAVLDQLFHLVTFCKMAAIPFDVYGFTTNNNRPNRLRENRTISDGEIEMDKLSMPQLISSSLSGRKYKLALEELYMKYRAAKSTSYDWTGSYDEEGYFSNWDIEAKCEEFGSTPLNAALIVTHRLVKKFKARHGIDKMNVIVLSDGDTNRLYMHSDNNIDKLNSYGFDSCSILVDKKWITSKGRGVDMTTTLLKNLQKRYGCTTLGFFIGDNIYDFKSKVRQIEDDYYYDPKPVNKEYRKNKCIARNNVLGYNEFYLVKGGKTLNTEEVAFDPKSSKTNAIRTAFKKTAESKKKNKVLLTKFGKAVA